MNSVVEFSSDRIVSKAHLKHQISVKTADSETSEDEQTQITLPIHKIQQKNQIVSPVIPDSSRVRENLFHKIVAYTSTLSNCDKVFISINSDNSNGYIHDKNTQSF